MTCTAVDVLVLNNITYIYDLRGGSLSLMAFRSYSTGRVLLMASVQAMARRKVPWVSQSGWTNERPAVHRPIKTLENSIIFQHITFIYNLWAYIHSNLIAILFLTIYDVCTFLIKYHCCFYDKIFMTKIYVNVCLCACAAMNQTAQWRVNRFSVI